MAFYRAGHLCLCKIDIYQASTPEEIAAEIDKKWDYILSSLTATGDELEKTAFIDFKADGVKPAADGMLAFVSDISVSEEKLHEPGCYLEEIMDFMNEQHIGDGLPIVPPTRARYENMLTYCPFDPEMVLAYEVGPSGKNITVKDIAVAAVMAGCKPEHMPILVTAWKALADKRYNLLQSVTTSHPGGNLVLVSGPLAQELGISGKQGCLGPGWPANATIGRAVNLVIIDVCRSIPGRLRPRLPGLAGRVHLLFRRGAGARETGGLGDDQRRALRCGYDHGLRDEGRAAARHHRLPQS